MVVKTSTKQIIRRFTIFLFFTTFIISGSVLLANFGPKQYRYDADDSFNFAFEPPEGFTEFASRHNAILDQHSHTLYSDGSMTVEQNIEWHLAHGFNVTFITDHNNMNHKKDVEKYKEIYKDRIVVIMGMEYTTNRIHMNLLGINEWDFSKFPIKSDDANIQAAINETHRLGGIVTVNHIPWSLRVGMDTHPNQTQLIDWGVDYVEIVNEYEFDYISARDYVNATGFGQITGTDVHRPDRVCGWTGLNITNFTVDAVMDALNNSKTAIFFNEIGSHDSSKRFENPAYEALKPFIYIGNMFENYWMGTSLDWAGIFIFAGYVFGFYVVFEVIRIKREKKTGSN